MPSYSSSIVIVMAGEVEYYWGHLLSDEEKEGSIHER